MGVELSGDADLARRIDARRTLRQERARLRCKRCQKAIPESRRRDALYCSAWCHDRHRWEQTTELRTEMRATFRTDYAPQTCGCGEALANRRRGPIAKSCKRCRDRESQRRRREKLADNTKGLRSDQMSEHTPEPWVFDYVDAILCGPSDGEPFRIGDLYVNHEFAPSQRALIPGVTERAANGRRIVACVNALKGIPTSALEAGAVAELIAACAELEGWQSTPGCKCARCRINPLLAKLKETP